jgi:hypothetical protein
MAPRYFYLKLGRVGHSSYRIHPPLDWVQRMGLNKGDEVEWVEAPDGSVSVKPLKADHALPGAGVMAESA